MLMLGLSYHSSGHEYGDTGKKENGREDNDSNEFLESHPHLISQHIRKYGNGRFQW